MNAQQAERIMMGMVLIYPGSIVKIRANIDPVALDDQAAQAVYKAICEIHDRGDRIDFGAIINQNGKISPDMLSEWVREVQIMLADRTMQDVLGEAIDLKRLQPNQAVVKLHALQLMAAMQAQSMVVVGLIKDADGKPSKYIPVILNISPEMLMNVSDFLTALVPPEIYQQYTVERLLTLKMGDSDGEPVTPDELKQLLVNAVDEHAGTPAGVTKQ